VIAEFITPTDPKWKAFLRTVNHDVYHLPEYVLHAAKYEKGEASAFYAEEGGKTVLIPLLFRKLPSCLKAPPDWRDAAAPYGYSSPLLFPGNNASFLDRSLEGFQKASNERNVVTAFTRFHPLMMLPMEEYKRHCEIIKHGMTVFIDLTASNEEFWHGTRENHKRDIAYLNRKGFTISHNDWGQLPGFIRMYHAAMDRLGAKPFYFFSHDYFKDLRAALEGHIHFFSTISSEGEMCAGGLFTSLNGIVELHLNATAEKYLSLSPMKLIFSFVREWAKANGNKFFHLGGGVGGQCDSLFRFKAGFSNRTSDFYTGRFVFNQERYEYLNHLWADFFQQKGELNDGFFPMYRRELTPANPSAVDVKREEQCFHEA
jgi:lipid II:glycine glycyltransferase (peptidoglycan interpeptide bridge formation enzyme)